jgi:hypothetical protein
MYYTNALCIKWRCYVLNEHTMYYTDVLCITRKCYVLHGIVRFNGRDGCDSLWEGLDNVVLGNNFYIKFFKTKKPNDKLITFQKIGYYAGFLVLCNCLLIFLP